MKLCKDCKWCYRNWFEKLFHIYSSATCIKLARINKVSGKLDFVPSCGVERAYKWDKCGEDAKLFEPIEEE